MPQQVRPSDRRKGTAEPRRRGFRLWVIIKLDLLLAIAQHEVETKRKVLPQHPTNLRMSGTQDAQIHSEDFKPYFVLVPSEARVACPRDTAQLSNRPLHDHPVASYRPELASQFRIQDGAAGCRVDERK